MPPPPTQLLLPQSWWSGGPAPLFPLRIKGPSTAGVLSFCLLYHVDEVSGAVAGDFDGDVSTDIPRYTVPRSAQSIVINCYGSRDRLIDALSSTSSTDTQNADEEHEEGGGGGEIRSTYACAADVFFTAAGTPASTKGRYRLAGRHLRVVDVGSVGELRGVAYLVSQGYGCGGGEEVPGTPGVEEEEESELVPPTARPPAHEARHADLERRVREADAVLKQSAARTKRKKPLLVVVGLDIPHRASGAWSAQGIAHTLAGLRAACAASGRELVVHDVSPHVMEPEAGMTTPSVKDRVESSVPLLSAGSRRPRTPGSRGDGSRDEDGSGTQARMDKGDSTADEGFGTDRSIPLSTVFRKAGINATWTPDATGLRAGTYTTDTVVAGQGPKDPGVRIQSEAWRVTWAQDVWGECADIRLERVPARVI
ncbi:hypothetical protein PYCC9005_006011 [Savitreella phatthalungensis]